MHVNVHIVGRKDGKVIAEHEGHNVWTIDGRSYLSSLLSYSDLVAELPFEGRRLKYMGFGVGGIGQSALPASETPPVIDDYPPGYDPNATGGHEYRVDYPLPVISTLERPVRITGGSGANAYDPVVGSDVWLQLPFIGTTFEAPSTSVLRCEIDTTANEVLYGPYLQMPISEMGLFLAASDENDPFNAGTGSMVAYHTFATLMIVPGSIFEFTWKVKF